MKVRSLVMKRLSAVRSLTAMFLAVSGLGLVGCASQTELPPQVTESLTDLRDQLIKGKAQVQTMSNAARDLTTRPQASLQPQVDRLRKSIADLEELATNHRKQFASAQERAQEYFAHWDKQMATMSNSMAARGQQRRAESMETFAELKSRTEELKKEFRPFMATLLEISRYLETDTTAAGVKVVTPQIEATLKNEKTIMQRADAVVAQIDAMRGGR